MKNNFTPDVILIDYLNICASSRVKMGGSINSYTLVKSIAEEMRGFAVENSLPIITATQTNRDGASTNDIDITNTSESFGLPMTLDLFLGVVQTEELAKLGQYLFVQLKNRLGDKDKMNKFFMGIDKPKMKLYDIDSTKAGGAATQSVDKVDNNKPTSTSSKFAGFTV